MAFLRRSRHRAAGANPVLPPRALRTHDETSLCRAGRPRSYRLGLRVRSEAGEQRLRVLLNDRFLEAVDVGREWAEREVAFSGGRCASRVRNSLRVYFTKFKSNLPVDS